MKSFFLKQLLKKSHQIEDKSLDDALNIHINKYGNVINELNVTSLKSNLTPFYDFYSEKIRPMKPESVLECFQNENFSESTKSFIDIGCKTVNTIKPRQYEFTHIKKITESDFSEIITLIKEPEVNKILLLD
jgi:hypothetical protein